MFVNASENRTCTTVVTSQTLLNLYASYHNSYNPKCVIFHLRHSSLMLIVISQNANIHLRHLVFRYKLKFLSGGHHASDVKHGVPSKSSRLADSRANHPHKYYQTHNKNLNVKITKNAKFIIYRASPDPPEPKIY